MAIGVSRENVISMMHSVVSVTTDIYPASYKTDSVLLTIIYPFLSEHNLTNTDGIIKTEISYNTLLKCLDDVYGIKNYLKEFKKNFKAEEGIEANYDKLIERYSSAEILLLYGIFQNLVYVNFNIHIEPDTRPQREKHVTTLKLPDIKIETLSIKLRDYCDQNLTDLFNKYIISNTGMEDNVMSKKNVFMTETIFDFFDIIDLMCKDIDDDQLLMSLHELFSFLNIDEIKESTLLIITDWPVL